MTKYHISCTYKFSGSPHFTIHDAVIDIHPLIWRSKNLDNVLIAWNEIPEEIENQIEDLEKERKRLINERTTRRMQEELGR